MPKMVVLSALTVMKGEIKFTNSERIVSARARVYVSERMSLCCYAILHHIPPIITPVPIWRLARSVSNRLLRPYSGFIRESPTSHACEPPADYGASERKGIPLCILIIFLIKYHHPTLLSSNINVLRLLQNVYIIIHLVKQYFVFRKNSK